MLTNSKVQHLLLAEHENQFYHWARSMNFNWILMVFCLENNYILQVISRQLAASLGGN